MSLLRQTASTFSRDVAKLATASRCSASRSLVMESQWTCWECRSNTTLSTRSFGRAGYDSARLFSTSSRRRSERSGDLRQPVDSVSTTPPVHTGAGTPASSSTTLPSHTANRRSDLSKRASQILDTLLARASVASQHINAYTGTDYSGIEALRREIKEQEQKVKALHGSVEGARDKHHDAHAIQSSSQREIVALLERKSSWSPTDLERYMSLVRSEHLNDQDVQVAKDDLATAERDLEEARSLLERLERKQYHEEQIWSDTIRRNSTWVTFGLMGVNILLLLAQIAIFEPYRRKKIVRDVKSALDEKTLVPDLSMSEVEKQIDAVIPPKTMTPEEMGKDLNQSLHSLMDTSEKNADGTSPAPSEVFPSDTTGIVTSGARDNEGEKVTKKTFPSFSDGSGTSSGLLKAYQEAIRDLFSDRQIMVRMVDITNTALQGAAAGVAIMGVLFVLLRPK